MSTLISHHTYERAQGVIEARLLDTIRLGQGEPMQVYEVLGRKGQVAPDKAEAACLLMVSLNCCDELHFWKQVFDGTQLVKELYGHPICQQLTCRPDMIGQTHCHRWGHGSPRTQ